MTTAGLDLMPLRKEEDRASEGARRTTEEERRIAGRVRYKEVSLGVGWKKSYCGREREEGGDSSADLGILGNF